MNYKFIEEAERNSGFATVYNRTNISSHLNQYSQKILLKNYHEPAFIGQMKDNAGINFIEVNAHLCNHLGYSREELMQKNPLEIFAHDTIPLAIKNFNLSLIKNRVHWEGIIIDKAGKRIPVEIKCCLLNSMRAGHILIVFKDISLYQQTMRELQNHKTLLNRAESIAKIGYWEYDLKSKKIWGSHGTRIIYGVGERELSLTEIQNLPLQKYRPQLDKMFSELITLGEKYDIEFEILRNSDNEVVYIHSMAEYDVFEKKIYGIVQDISDQKKVEKELIKAKEKAEESDRLKSAFLSNMSHEIRTPMNGILGFSQLLSHNNLSQESKNEYVTIINSCCNNLLDVINDILEIAKIETGQVTIHKTPVNIAGLLNKIAYLQKEAMFKKGLEIKIRNPLKKDLALITDKEKLNQILKNLVDNAIRFTSTGYIELGCELKDGFIEFTVRDTGIGISPDNYEKIFESFRQAEINTAVEYGGTGLGLRITKSFVNMLGGEIWLQSEIGAGTTFYFTLPAIEDDSVLIDKRCAMQPGKAKTKSCLIVEDFEINYLLLKAILGPLDLNVLWAKSGKEALEIVENFMDIDFVLMDIRLPDMDGYTVTRKIKSMYPDMPIIAQTANALVNEKEKAFEAGCDNYVTKPIYKEELISKISVYI